MLRLFRSKPSQSSKEVVEGHSREEVILPPTSAVNADVTLRKGGALQQGVFFVERIRVLGVDHIPTTICLIATDRISTLRSAGVICILGDRAEVR